MIPPRRASRAFVLAFALATAVVGQTPGPAPTPAADNPVAQAPNSNEPFPGVRVDLAAKTVEFEGVIPIDVRNPDGTPIFLETVACTPDTREHEALVTTTARPSDIHAALLMIGLEPGKPGGFVPRDEPKDPSGKPGAGAHRPTRFDAVPPEGDAVKVEFIVAREGNEVVEPAQSWIAHDRTLAPMPDAGFVFAGSRFVKREGKERYDADGAGTLIGLHTFGSETIAWRGVMSPEAGVEEPVWVAHPERTPPVGTRIRVRLSRGG